MKVFRAVSVAAVATALLGGCATNSAVDKRIEASQAETNRRIETVATQVEDLQTSFEFELVKLPETG